MSHLFAHGFEPEPDPRDDCGSDGKLPEYPIDCTLMFDEDKDLRELTIRKQDVQLPVLDFEKPITWETLNFVYMGGLNRIEILEAMKRLETFGGDKE